MTHTNLTIPLRLLRLTSSLLPVGAFAYSRGLENAAHAGWVKDGAQVQDWIFGTLAHFFAPLDGALVLRMICALQDEAPDEFARLDALLMASRESHELLMEDRRMAEAMLTLLRDMGVAGAQPGDAGCSTYTGAYALAVHDLGVTAQSGLHGLLWSVCEAQVAAAIRLGIIGQSDGQRILGKAPDIIANCARVAAETPDDSIGNLSFMLAVGSAMHETQYSRLFRS